MLKIYLLDTAYLAFHAIQLLVIQLMRQNVGQQINTLFIMLSIISAYYVITNTVYLFLNFFDTYGINLKVQAAAYAFYVMIPTAYLLLSMFFAIPRLFTEQNNSLYISYFIFYKLYTGGHSVYGVRSIYLMYDNPWMFRRPPTRNAATVYIEPEPPKCVIIEKPLKPLDGDTKCCICMERVPDTKLVPCGHKEFCFDCVQKVFPNCPMCRGKFNMVDYECIKLST